MWKIDRAHLLGFSDGGNIAKIPIEIGYGIARKFADKSDEAKKNAEILGLMVHEPNIAPEELSRIKAKTLVIAGTRDMIREDHTKLIADSIPEAELAFIKGSHFIANKNVNLRCLPQRAFLRIMAVKGKEVIPNVKRKHQSN